MKRKQISGGVVLSFISQIVSVIVGLVYTPIMIRILGQNEYGLYQLVLSFVDYLNLMNFGFSGAYIRYYAMAKNKNDKNEVANINGMFLKIFLFLACLCLGVGVALYFNIGILGTKLKVEDYVVAKKLLLLLVINLAVSFPNSLFVAFISANERFIFQKGLNIIVNVLIPILNLPLLLLGFGSVGVVSITLLSSIIRLLVNLIYCFKVLNIRISIRYFDKFIFLNLLSYTFFIFLSDLVDQLNSNVDKLLLGRYTGTIAVAVYSAGYNLKNYITVISWIIPEMYIPEVNRLAIKEKSDTKLTELFAKVGRFNNYIILLALTAFIMCGKQFIFLWIGSEYEISYYVAVILMIAGYIPAVQTLGPNVQTAKNMHQMRSIIFFMIAVLNVISSICLIKYFGVIGTCLGTFFATIIGHGFFMNYYYHKYVGLDIKLFWKTIVKWYPVVIVLFFFGELIVRLIHIKSWISLLMFCMIYVGIYGIALLLFGLNKEEQGIVMDRIKMRIKI